ncbi:MAG: glycosyltransferase family 2 protein [Candidatus Saganbacteria bacterium]|nr:glycosyltransferase family 2 protein [Candidatus Saganbacteria bacterium]
MSLSVSVIILTHNEELNLELLLKNVKGWASDIFIVDSFSNDKTLEIATKYTDKIYQHKFKDFSDQRNWALRNLPFSNEWVLFLDADERLSDKLKIEIEKRLPAVKPQINGFYIKRRVYFMGRWMKHGGYYPHWLLRLVRHKKASCEREINEHLVVPEPTLKLKEDILHISEKDLTFWIAKHNRFATMEALQLMKDRGYNLTSQSSVDKKRMLRWRRWNKMPVLIRPLFYFLYRYFIKLGFLDGKEGLIFHFLQGFWYFFLIDAKYYEMQMNIAQGNK